MSIKRTYLLREVSLLKIKLTNGVGHKSSSDGDSPSEEEGHGDTGVVSEEDGLQSVEEPKVHATVDEDTDGGDGESSVQTLNTVRLESLGVDIDQAVELPLTSLALGVIGQPERRSES